MLIKSLARDPNHRYADMAAFALALENLAGQNGTTLDETGDESDYLGNANGVTPTVDEPVITGSTKNKLILPGILLAALAVCFIIGAGVFIAGRNLLSPSDPTAAPAGNPPSDSAAETPEEPFPTDIASEVTEVPSDTPVPASPVPEIPAPATNGKWIAFYSNKSGNDNIYIVDTDGNNLTEITTSPAHDRYPSWSPDGRQIVYETNEGGDQELMVIDVESRELRKLTSNDCNDFEPSWSPAGDWIAYYSDCDREREIYKVCTNGNDRQQLIFSTGAYNWFPSWSPDGNKITFSSNRSGKYYVYVMNADGSDLQQLARGCVSNFSPDGSQIVYGVYCTDTDALWIMNSDGSGQQQITEGVECKNANWSPDGTKIVFGRSKTTKDGPFAVFIMSLDNPDPSNWTQITEYDINGRSPVWQP